MRRNGQPSRQGKTEMSMVRKALASEYGYRASVLGEAAAPEEGLAEGRALVERAIKAKAKFLTMPKGTRNAPLFMEGAGGLRLELRAAPAALTDWSRTFVALRMSYPLVTAGPEGSDADAKGREAAYAAEVKALFKRLEAPLAELAQPGDANPAGPPLATYAKQVVRDCSRLALEAVRSGEAGRAGEVVGHMALAVCRGLSEGPDSQALKALRALALDLGERRNRFIWRRAPPRARPVLQPRGDGPFASGPADGGLARRGLRDLARARRQGGPRHRLG